MLMTYNISQMRKKAEDTGLDLIDLTIIAEDHTQKHQGRGGCIFEAIKLRIAEGCNGDIWWVPEYKGESVMHAYYVPEGCDDSENARNQLDNGYADFPALNALEVREIGIPVLLDKELIRQFSFVFPINPELLPTSEKRGNSAYKTQ